MPWAWAHVHDACGCVGGRIFAQAVDRPPGGRKIEVLGSETPAPKWHRIFSPQGATGVRQFTEDTKV